MSLIPDSPKPTLAGLKIALNQLIEPLVDGLLPGHGTRPIEKLAKYFVAKQLLRVPGAR